VSWKILEVGVVVVVVVVVVFGLLTNLALEQELELKLLYYRYEGYILMVFLGVKNSELLLLKLIYESTFVAGLESDYLLEKQPLCYFSAYFGVYPLEAAGL